VRILNSGLFLKAVTNGRQTNAIDNPKAAGRKARAPKSRANVQAPGTTSLERRVMLRIPSVISASCSFIERDIKIRRCLEAP
jgi:hypothetical protein